MNPGAFSPQADIRPAGRLVRRDRRRQTFLLLFVLVVAAWLVVNALPQRGVDATRLAATERPNTPSGTGFSSLAAARDSGNEGKPMIEDSPPVPAVERDPAMAETRRVLGEARSLIRNKRYDDAIHLLNQSRPKLQQYAETYLVLGKALEGRRDFRVARDFYVAAINRDPYLADAYWGIATSSERLGELDSALGAMRSYLHTEPDPDPQRLRIAQARSAIWEWESKLGRGPWGPTRGIPPGFTPEDLKRDGRGVGVMIPRLDTLQADGTMMREVKHADKVKIFPRP